MKKIEFEFELKTVLRIVAVVTAVVALFAVVMKYRREIRAFAEKIASFFAGLHCPCCKKAKKPVYTEEELSDFADVEV